MEPGDSNRVMNEFHRLDDGFGLQEQQPLRAPVSEEDLRLEVVGKKGKVRASVRETGYDSMRNYIKSMCNHELLNKNEEVVLGREIQILIRWEEEREKLEAQLLRYVVTMRVVE